MRKSIEKLIASGTSAYRVSKETGITLSVIQKIFNGTSKLDNISLKNAEILTKYWEENKMKQTFEKVLQAVEGKYNTDNAGIAYYENLEDMYKRYEELDWEREELQERLEDGAEKGFDFKQLDKPFIVYDYATESFTFLTTTDEYAVQRFVDRVLAP